MTLLNPKLCTLKAENEPIYGVLFLSAFEAAKSSRFYRSHNKKIDRVRRYDDEEIERFLI
jgi:hypothetical protein